MSIYPTDYTGFVYIWFDRKRKWFCIGSHMGTIDDGYISSTGFIGKSYRKRPEDFKRKILEFYYGNEHKELLKLEQKYLDMIKDEELCLRENINQKTTRYYNIKKNASGLSGKSASIIAKKSWENNDERRRKASEISKGNQNGRFRKNTKHSEETKRKIGLANTGKTHSPERIEQGRKNTKELWERGVFDNRPKPTKEQKERMSAARKGEKRSDETKKNISNALKGNPKSDAAKANMSEAAKKLYKVKVVCPHCNFVGSGPAMRRFHFTNCKSILKFVAE